MTYYCINIQTLYLNPNTLILLFIASKVVRTQIVICKRKKLKKQSSLNKISKFTNTLQRGDIY